MKDFLQHLSLLAAILIPVCIKAQEQTVRYEVEAQAIGTTNDVVPFWMRSNQYGSIPSQGVSGSFIGRAYKEYDPEKAGIFDWGAGFEGRANAGDKSKLLLIEGYAKVRAGIFQLKAGRSKDVMGLNGDTTLSSGNFVFSGNALGIPKVEISIPEYWTVPVLDGLLAFKGNVVYGWAGKTRLRDSIGGPTAGSPFIPSENPIKTYFHQKSLYGRFGKPDWNLKIYGGFSHNVFWSDERKIYGDAYDLSPLESFFYVFTGKTYGGRGQGIALSKVGNHIGSIDIGFDYNFPNVKLSVYRQFFYETGGLAHLANVKDGLNGVSLVNTTAEEDRNIRWRKFLFEFLYTKNQAGEPGSRRTNSGDEDYYNNYLYLEGWSYKDLGLGNPFITTKNSAREGLPAEPYAFFLNNRVIAFHGAAEIFAFNWYYTGKISYSRNFGTFGTSAHGRTTGGQVYEPRYGIFPETGQFSASLEASRSLGNGINIGYLLALDQGDLLKESVGIMLRASKSF